MGVGVRVGVGVGVCMGVGVGVGVRVGDGTGVAVGVGAIVDNNSTMPPVTKLSMYDVHHEIAEFKEFWDQ